MKISEVEIGAEYGVDLGSIRNGYARGDFPIVRAVSIETRREEARFGGKPRNVRVIVIEAVEPLGSPRTAIGETTEVLAERLWPADVVRRFRSEATALAAAKTEVEGALRRAGVDLYADDTTYGVRQARYEAPGERKLIGRVELPVADLLALLRQASRAEVIDR